MSNIAETATKVGERLKALSTPTPEGEQRAAEATSVGATAVAATWQINRAIENGDVEASMWLAEHLDDYERLRDRAHAHELFADQLRQ